MVANILPTDTPSTKGVGSKGQTIYFSESSHVAYQIKADNAGSNMVANILPTDTPLSCCISNLRELSTEHHESKCAVITHTNNPWGGIKWSFLFFSKSGHVAYQSKVEEV